MSSSSCFDKFYHDPSEVTVMKEASEAALSGLAGKVSGFTVGRFAEDLRCQVVLGCDIGNLVAIYKTLQQAKVCLKGVTEQKAIRAMERDWADCFVWRCQLGKHPVRSFPSFIWATVSPTIRLRAGLQ